MEDLILKYDKDFDEALFTSRVDNMYIRLLNSITERDLSNVKHYLSKELFDKYTVMIDGYKRNKLIRLFDEMNVKTSSIINVKFADNKIYIYVLLTSRYMDYFIDENGDYVSGNNKSRIINNNYITLCKDINSKDLGEVRRCPNCGKTLDLNHSGVCAYCNSTIELSDYDYIITSIEVK